MPGRRRRENESVSKETRLAAISAALASAAAAFLLLFPTYTGVSGGVTTHATLLEVNGSWAVGPVLFPVVIAVLPLLFARQFVRVAAAVAMSGFLFIAMSIGFFYLPSAFFMVLAACVTDRVEPEVR